MVGIRTRTRQFIGILTSIRVMINPAAPKRDAPAADQSLFLWIECTKFKISRSDPPCLGEALGRVTLINSLIVLGSIFSNSQTGWKNHFFAGT